MFAAFVIVGCNFDVNAYVGFWWVGFALLLIIVLIVSYYKLYFMFYLIALTLFVDFILFILFGLGLLVLTWLGTYCGVGLMFCCLLRNLFVCMV